MRQHGPYGFVLTMRRIVHVLCGAIIALYRRRFERIAPQLFRLHTHKSLLSSSVIALILKFPLAEAPSWIGIMMPCALGS